MLKLFHFKITIPLMQQKLVGRSASRTDLCINAAVTQRPGFTRVLAHGTHDGGVGFADLLADRK